MLLAAIVTRYPQNCSSGTNENIPNHHQAEDVILMREDANIHISGISSSKEVHSGLNRRVRVVTHYTA
jgi:hypothetical protein